MPYILRNRDYEYSGNTKSDFPLGYLFGENSYLNATKTSQPVYLYWISGGSNRTEYYYIPNSLTNIIISESNNLFSNTYGTFKNCSNLRSVTILDGIKGIARYSFSGCSSLTTVILPSSLISIGGGAFSSCSSLSNIIIPSGVTSIGSQTFYNCSCLTTVEL